MYEKVKAYVQEHHMLTQTDSVIAGVSGGADSVCLLFILRTLQKEMGFSLTAVHIHHGIRGESADEDEAFVRRLCGQEGVPLLVFHEDVPGYAKAHGLGEEEAGRQVRVQVLENAAKEMGGTKIALAHHRNDNAETLILNLCRGTGPLGLAGMKPVSGKWIRPLLCVTRAEIEDWLHGQGIEYRTDETNLEDTYTRNRIRNHVIPYLETHVNSRSVEHMTDTMEEMRLLDDWVEEEIRRYLRQCGRREAGGLIISREEFARVPEALRPYVLRQALYETAGARQDIGAVHVRSLEDLMENQTGRQISLPYGVTAERIYEGIRLVRDDSRPQTGGEDGPETGEENAQETSKEDADAQETGKEDAPEGKFRMRIFERPERMPAFPTDPYTKWFDYDIIKNAVKLRHRMPGDFLTIDQNGGTQKLKQYFINEKIPACKRDKIWLAADGSHIMWVVGYRQNQAYQITDRTRRILEIVYEEGEGHG